MTIKLGLSIVNFKTAQLVQECVKSVLADSEKLPNMTIVIVDNDSQDGSFERLSTYIEKQSWSHLTEVVAAEKNGGFSYGNNIAFKKLAASGCTHVWMLNPDTIVRTGAARALYEALESSQEIVAAGSRLEDPDGTVQVSAFNTPSPWGEFVNKSEFGLLQRLFPNHLIARPPPQSASYVDWVAGASIMIKMEALQKAGFMDESYFLYFEEVDLCLALAKSGGKITYVPESRVVHHVGAATGISNIRLKPSRLPAYWFESRQRFFQKNYGFIKTLCADILWLLAYFFCRIKAFLLRKALWNPPKLLSDFLKHSSLSRGRIL